MHTQDTHAHNSRTYIPKNTELTTGFYQDSEEVSHHVKANINFLLREFYDLPNIVKNTSLHKHLVQINRRDHMLQQLRSKRNTSQ